MSGSKADKSRFWVTFFLEDLAEGSRFTPGALHLTIVPWFVADKPDEEVVDSFKRSFSGLRAFTVHLGQKARFGPRENAPITLVEPSEELLGLHGAALDWLRRIEGRWAVKNPYVGEEFRPHIRRRRGTRLGTENINIDALWLIKAPRREDHQRQVAARVGLL